MTDLADFLLARIAEDEAVARAEVERLRGAPRRGGKTTAARRWAECEAKRQIVALHPITHKVEQWKGTPRFDFGCELCHEDDGVYWPGGDCDTMRALALPYAGHPDYREEWRP